MLAKLSQRFLTLGILALGMSWTLVSTAPAADLPAPVPGIEVLAQGPVHEAYAEPADFRPEASPLIAKQPPDPVPEAPPDQKPEGDNVQWIPGYWSWDPQGDFIWISGFWRNLPPGQQWVPGHWQQAAAGWQWVPGFWTSAAQAAVEYLPAPPPLIDAAPSAPAPNDTSIYVPGIWVYRDARYLWRPGFWIAYQPAWVWIPAHYVWTPGGYIFIEGYWDHPLSERGLLFAPVRIDRRVVVANWTYVPQYVVQQDFLIGALFVGPGHHHFYFGDYFEASYA